MYPEALMQDLDVSLRFRVPGYRMLEGFLKP